jgi:protein-S-isoprenylcysteine O-methyltransferase Ste14
MSLSTVILIIWGVFWLCWLLAAFTAKRSTRRGGVRPPGLVVLVTFLLLRAFRTGTLSVHSPVLEGVGVVLFAAGLGVAVSARIYLGRNWGMPMTQKDQPELVTSGPYRFVRHPIYSGILLAILGTALATNLYWLIALVVLGAYFAYSATVEERNLANDFPAAYSSYRARTKLLIPFVL